MLRLWPNQCSVLLSLDQIVVTHHTGLNNKVVTSKTVAINNDARSWPTLIQELNQVLTTLALPQHTKLHILLASDLVRYITLPTHNTSMSQEEKLGYANALYSETYGAKVADWVIKCDETAPSDNTLVAAIDQQLLLAINTVATTFKLTLCSVQPYLMGAFNALYPLINKAINKANALLIVIEINRFLVIHLKNGVYEKVRNYKFEQNLDAQLLEVLKRENLYGEVGGNRLFLYAPTQKSSLLNDLADWKVTRLQVNKLHIARMQLDFIEKNAFSFGNLHKTNLAMLLLSLGLAGYLAFQYQAKFARHKKQLQALSMQAPAIKQSTEPASHKTYSDEEVQEMQKIFVNLSMPWNQLLNALEHIEIKDLSLLSVEPNVKSGQILLKGQSRELAQILSYVEALEKSAVLQEVYLQKHHVENAEPLKPISFEVVAKWQ